MKRAIRTFLERYGSLTVDILSTFLLLFATAIVLMHWIGQEATPWQIAAYAAGALLLCVLISREKLVLPMLIGIPALFGAVVGVLELTHHEAWAYVVGFYHWCMSGLVQTDPYSYDLSLHVVRAAMLIPLAALLFAFHRKFYFLIPLLLFSAGLVVYAQYYELDARYILLAALLIVNLTGLAHTTHRAVRKTLGKRIVLPEAAMRAAAMVFSALVVLVSFQIARAPDGKWTSQVLHRITNDLSDFVAYHVHGSGNASNFSIGWSGYSPNGDLLGGDVYPDNTIVIRVRTETPSLLTGSVFDTYDGSRWLDTNSYGNFRLNSVLWSARQREAFASTNPRGGRRAKRLYDEITIPASMYMSPTLLYRNYFIAGIPRSWEFGPGCLEAYFNSQGEIYMNEPPERGFSYTVTSTIFDFYADDFETQLLALEEMTEEARDPLLENIEAVYLQLPETLPLSVRAAAEEITAGAETQAEKAFALLHWLEDNCTYTTTPGEADPKRDFVEQFLENREGYCTYYATAMTVLARCVGLPARYVTGFGMKQNPDKAQKGYVNFNFLVTNECAHAWTEVYLAGIGWVPFDSADFELYEVARVPVSSAEKPAEGGSGAADPALQDIDALLQELEAMENEQILPEQELPENVPVTRRVPWGWIGTAAALILALVITLLTRKRKLMDNDAALLRRVRRRHPGYSDIANILYDRCLDQLRLLGIFYLPGETLQGFSVRLGKHFPLEASLITSAVSVIERMDYGLIQPRDRDLERLAKLSAFLETALRDELGRRGYFWRRIADFTRPRRKSERRFQG